MKPSKEIFNVTLIHLLFHTGKYKHSDKNMRYIFLTMLDLKAII